MMAKTIVCTTVMMLLCGCTSSSTVSNKASSSPKVDAVDQIEGCSFVVETDDMNYVAVGVYSKSGYAITELSLKNNIDFANEFTEHNEKYDSTTVDTFFKEKCGQKTSPSNLVVEYIPKDFWNKEEVIDKLKNTDFEVTVKYGTGETVEVSTQLPYVE